jgi:hypothetical protein
MMYDCEASQHLVHLSCVYLPGSKQRALCLLSASSASTGKDAGCYGNWVVLSVAQALASYTPTHP